MSWMAKLYDTYEHALKLDLPRDQQVMPICHTLQNAHIHITIDGEGHFRQAKVLEKTQIVLPATESSAGRSSGEASHPLADKLQYVAKDYAEYGGQKKPYFPGYLKQLQEWCESDFPHPHVVAVYQYVQRGKVIQDLVQQGIAHLDADGNLLDRWVNDATDAPPLFKSLPKKTGGIVEQGDALVCWSVESGTDPNVNTWQNESLQQSWVAYCASKGGREGFCYVTGESQILAVNHPAKLRHTGDKAKLVSSNDLSGFTFRGRFTDTKKTIDDEGYQSVGVGVQISQKAHNALQWLIVRQGFRNVDQVIVAWAVSGKPTPDPAKDTRSVISVVDLPEEPIEDSGDTQEEAQLNHTRDAGQSFANALKKKMKGYKAVLLPTEDVVIMGIDSATPGRMAITYYREALAHEFIDVITQWHNDLAWFQRYKKEVANGNKKAKSITIWPISAPAPKTIIEMVYGKTLSDTLKKNLMQRLLPCIVEGHPIPVDIVQTCVNRASNPNGMDYWEWEQCLGIACSLYKGYYLRHPDQQERRTYLMALDETNSSRDYLYGRLLAVAERIEYIALQVSGEKRPTNAERLMQRFADRPFSTWRTIELSLAPYMQRLKTSRAGFLTNRQKELDAIHATFVGNSYINDAPLSGEFLLGFHSQRLALRNKTSDEPETSSNNGE